MALTRALRLGAAAAVLVFAACASGPPPLESTLRVWDLGAREVEAIGSWRTHLVSGVGTDWARKVLCHSDGACVFFGSTRGSFGPSTDFIAMGEIPEQRFQWARTYGGGDVDELDGAAAVPGGALMFGQSASVFGASGPSTVGVAPRPLLVRVDEAGAPVWARTVDAGGLERFHEAATAGDGVVLVGYAGLGGDVPSVAAARFGHDGSLRWAQAYDLGAPGYGVAVAPAAGGGVVLAGYLRLPNVAFAGTPFVLAVDAAGRPLWARRYDMEGPAQPRSLLALADGGLVLGGTLWSARPGRSPFVIRLGPDGAPRLGRELRGLEAIEAMAVADAGNAGVVVAGRRRDPFTDRHWGFAMLVDDRGRITAHATLLAQGSVEFPGVATARDGEYRVAGSTNSLGAAGLDIVVGSWRPSTPGGTAGIAARLAERDLVVKAGDVTARAQSLTVRVSEVPLAALQVRSLEVPTALGR